MSTQTLSSQKRASIFAGKLLVSMAFTGFLFFIDEGYYNFNWTLKIWNWIFFVIYVVAILLGQIIAESLILKNYYRKGKALLTLFIGIPLGLTILFAIGYLWKSTL